MPKYVRFDAKRDNKRHVLKKIYAQITLETGTVLLFKLTVNSVY